MNFDARLASILFALSFFLNGFSQRLIINEVSQGNLTAEYVELVVVGNPICDGQTIPCIDLRKMIIDDNNGFFAAGGGTGIAAGALRFSGSSFWSCVPQGTFIVIYNEVTPNSAIPNDDLSLNDGNCRLIIPGSSNLLESPTTNPIIPNFNAGSSNYPLLDSEWGPSTGWISCSMSNSDDSFQIRRIVNNGTQMEHAVSWGNNTNGTIISFPGGVSNKVISFVNSTSNDFNLQANWVIGDFATGQTPGQANSLKNDLWIGTMNPECRVNPLLSFVVTNEDCNAGNGAISLTVNNIPNFTVSWETGSNQQNISNLSAGIYTVSVSDQLTGCVLVDSAEVVLNSGNLSLNVNSVNETCAGMCDGIVNLTINGGQQPYDTLWFNGSGNSIPEPTVFCNGQYAVEVRDNLGCSTQQQAINIQTTDSASYVISGDLQICLGDTVDLSVSGASVLWSTGDPNGTIAVHPSQTTTYNAIIMEGACVVNESVTVEVENCGFGIEFPNVFTPNSDGLNDFFEPLTLGGIDIKSFLILNRWGEVMYETDQEIILWSGKTAESKEAAEGVYFYKAVYHKLNESEEHTLHGFIHLIRK